MGFFDLFKSRSKEPPRDRLTVYATVENLPWPVQIAHPHGLWDALLGEPRVVNPRRDPKAMLEQSMEDGEYIFEGPLATVVAGVDRMRRGDPFPGRDFDGKGPMMGPMERELLENSLWRVDLQVTEVVTHAKPALEYMVEMADRLALLSDGVVLDHQASRYYLPGGRRRS